MKKVVLSVITAAFICVFVLLPLQACSEQTGETAQKSPGAIKNIGAPEAYLLIEEQKDNTDFVILDVRAPGEYSQGHIENAVNIDYTAESFSDEVGKLDRSKTYIVYCRSGRRSRGATGIMSEMGFQNLINMQGGILSWQSSGHPVTK